MRKQLWFGVIGAALAWGCDARMSEEYRGEPLLSVTGRLVIDEEGDWAELAPVVAFFDPAKERTFQILDVDTRGEFPANFTIDLMLPPPMAAIHTVENMPTVALGVITALPKDHAAEFTPPLPDPTYPSRVARERCDVSGCYLKQRVCLTATDCYQDERRCSDSDFKVCDEILEQLGEPAILAAYEAFERNGERADTEYLVLYVADDGPLDSTRGYAHSWLGPTMSAVFGMGPITAGYHLLRSGPATEAEWQPSKQCRDTASNVAARRIAERHGESFRDYGELFVYLLMQNVEMPFGHPYYSEYDYEFTSETYEQGCLANNTKRIDPSNSTFEITLDHRHLNFF